MINKYSEIEIKINQGEFNEAIKILKEYIKQNNDYYAQQLIGICYANIENYKEALNHLNISIQANGNDSNAFNNRGLIYEKINETENAINDYKNAIKINPNSQEANYNYANILSLNGKYTEAIKYYSVTINVNPNHYMAYNNRGSIFYEQKEIELAIKDFQNSLKINPNYAEAYHNLGMAWHGLGNYKEAHQNYIKAITLNNNETTWYSLGELKFDLGNFIEAQDCYKKAIEINPNLHIAEIAECMAEIPKIYQTPEINSEKLNKILVQKIRNISEKIKNLNEKELKNLIGVHQPFFLAYLNQNNAELLKVHGELFNKKVETKNRIKKNKIKKVGFVSSFIKDHSVWNAITKGWIENLSKKNLSIEIFHISNEEDEESKIAKLNSNNYFSGNMQTKKWIDKINESELDLIIYPEIGMEKITTQIANERLAPIQIVSWGHPETTGIPTIDYFLSAELFENDKSQKNYTEHLLTISGTSSYLHKKEIKIENIELEKYGIDKHKPVIICPGTPFKYLPENDDIFVKIAAEKKDAQFIFFEFETMLTNIVKERIKKRLINSVISTDKNIIYLPYLAKHEFYNLMAQADLYLDSISFSGFNTAIMALEVDLPVITMEGNFLRNRLASGILKKIECEDLIVKTKDDMINKIIEYLENNNMREEIKRKIRKNREKIFYDKQTITSLESILLNL